MKVMKQKAMKTVITSNNQTKQFRPRQDKSENKFIGKNKYYSFKTK